MTATSESQRRWRLLHGILALRRPGRATQAAVAVVAIGAIVGIGLVDYATGRDLSLAVFYLIPVTVGTVLLGTRAGVGLAAESATVWVLAEAFIHNSRLPIAVQAWNGLLRFAILAFVVVLVAGLREALDDSRDAEQRSREFLAYAAHQLRTPIAAIRTSAEALSTSPGTETQENLLVHLVTESARAGHLVGSLLRVARLDQGEPLERRLTDLRTLCREEARRQAALAASIDVSIDVDPAVPAWVVVSPEATGEALGNLLDNARTHAVESVTVAVSSRAGTLRISVRDDGPGLPPGAEERAFDRFVSLDAQGGAGLGLPIARRLTEVQGGTLTYRDGAFTMSLPLRVEQPTPVRHGSPVVTHATANEGPA
jgi:signal transduction histidine kinase